MTVSIPPIVPRTSVVTRLRATRRNRHGDRTVSAWIPGVSRALTLVAVVFLIGVLPWLSGQDPALKILRARSADQTPSPEALTAIRTELGLEGGPFVMFGTWLGNLFQGDAGTSWVSGRPVFEPMMEALQVSLTLMMFSAITGIVVGVLLSIRTLIKGLNGRPTNSHGSVAALLTALPEFLLASLVLIVFAVWLQWFPPFGWKGIEYAVLPALAMGLPAGGLLGRLFSNALVATFNEAWVRTWVVSGYSKPRIGRAVIRRALPGLMTQFGLVMVGLTGGAVAVEQVFTVPGIGRETLLAAQSQDMPSLQIGVLMLIALAVFCGLITTIGRKLLLGPALKNKSVPRSVPPTPSGPRAWILPAICTAALTALILAGLGRDAYAMQFGRLAPPSWAAPLGSDAVGRDLLARVSQGALSTIGIAVIVIFSCLALGLLIGLFPSLATGPIEVTNAAPPIVAGLIVAAIFGSSAMGAAVAVTAVSWAPLAAHTAALAGEVKAQPHVQILPILGVGNFRLLTRYVLPAVFGQVFKHAMLRFPGTALALAALGFLGLGPQPPKPEWGLVLAEGMPYMERAPWAVLVPVGALIILAILGVALSNISANGKFFRRKAKTEVTAPLLSAPVVASERLANN
jgi:peptide/nickel transport system permease protein